MAAEMATEMTHWRIGAKMAEIPAHLDVQFEEGVPVSVNGVPMALPELIESVSTIATNHGVAPEAVSLSAVPGALTGDGRHTGVVRLTLFRGEHTIGPSLVAVGS
jgi:hypothetical protein